MFWSWNLYRSRSNFGGQNKVLGGHQGEVKEFCIQIIKNGKVKGNFFILIDLPQIKIVIHPYSESLYVIQIANPHEIVHTIIIQARKEIFLVIFKDKKLIECDGYFADNSRKFF